MVYPNQKDSAWYLVGKKNELEKSLSRKIARFRRNSRVIPGFFSFLINKVGPGHLLKFFTKDVSPEVWRAAFSGSLWAWMVWAGLGWALFLLHTKDTHWLRMWRPSCSSCALRDASALSCSGSEPGWSWLPATTESSKQSWSSRIIGFHCQKNHPVLQSGSFFIQHYLFCSWSLASVTSSPGVVAYTALKLRLYSFQLQNNSVLHTSAASETITSYMVHFCNSLTKMAASCWTDLSVVSRGRGRDRECRHSPNVVTNNFNFNQTLFGL